LVNKPPPNLPHFYEIGEEFSDGFFLLFGLVFVYFEQYDDGIFDRDNHSVQILYDLIIPETQDAVAVSGPISSAAANSPYPASPKVCDFRGGDNTSFLPYFRHENGGG
jgi:hypothetical protein